MNKIWHKRLSDSYRRWDRSTAYMLHLQHKPYNQRYEEAMKNQWDADRDEFELYLRSIQTVFELLNAHYAAIV